MTSRLLTAREVGQLLGVHAETILRWHRRNLLPGIRLPGGAIRFREDQIDRWLEERATTGRGVSTAPAAAAQQLRYPVSTALQDEES